MTPTPTSTNAADASQSAFTITFARALEACKLGHRIARFPWPGGGTFVFLLTGMHRYPDSTRCSHVIGIPADLFEAVDPTTPQKHLPHGAKTRAPMLCLVQGTVITAWSPTASDVFAADWLDLDAPADPRPAWQARVITELAELDEKRRALDAFLRTEPSPATATEVQRLTAQLDAMTTYRDVLADRIHHFDAQP